MGIILESSFPDPSALYRVYVSAVMSYILHNETMMVQGGIIIIICIYLAIEKQDVAICMSSRSCHLRLSPGLHHM